MLTAVWLTLILGAALVASGIMSVFLGFNMKGGTPWGWVVASGLITLLLGIIILIHWPVYSLYALGNLSGRRSCVRGRELDRTRHGVAASRLTP